VKVDALEPFWYHLEHLGYDFHFGLCDALAIANVIALSFKALD
jgi:hypothetical protein